jgi:predicted Zn-dependent protease
MRRLTSTPLTERLYPGLLLVVTVALYGFLSTATAHVGVHEEIEILSRLIEQDPSNPELYVSRGEAYRLHRRWDSAIKEFSKALDIAPDNVAATIGLGRTYLDKGNPSRALTFLDKSLAQEPGNVRALILRAQANMKTGKPLKAAADYSSAIEKFSGKRKPLPDYYLDRARAYAAAGDTYLDRALQGLDEGITVLGNIRALELYAVELEIMRGNPDSALERLDSILARATRKEFLLLQRGDILTAADRTTEAIRNYLAAKAAIENLPSQRRYTRPVKQLQADLNDRLISLGSPSDHD